LKTTFKNLIISTILGWSGFAAAEQTCPEKIESRFCDSLATTDSIKLIGFTIDLKLSGTFQTCDKTAQECKNEPPYDYPSDTNLIRSTKELFSTYDLRWPANPEVRANAPDSINDFVYHFYAKKETIYKIGEEKYIVSVHRWEPNGPSGTLPQLQTMRSGVLGQKFNVKGQKIRKAEKGSAILLQRPPSGALTN